MFLVCEFGTFEIFIPNYCLAKPHFSTRGKTSDWTVFAGKPPLIDQRQGREKMTSVCFGLLWSEKCKQNHALVLNRIRIQT